jgi:hypothetical protein
MPSPKALALGARENIDLIDRRAVAPARYMPATARRPTSVIGSRVTVIGHTVPSVAIVARDFRDAIR